MFDANARYLPDGKLFFAECHSIDYNFCQTYQPFYCRGVDLTNKDRLRILRGIEHVQAMKIRNL